MPGSFNDLGQTQNLVQSKRILEEQVLQRSQSADKPRVTGISLQDLMNSSKYSPYK